MHPDALIAGLERELEQCGDDNDRRQEILGEIAVVDKLDRPAAIINSGSLEVADRDQGYLAGLRRELESAERERHDEIKSEIVRIEDAIRSKPEQAEPVGEPEEADEASVEPASEPGSDLEEKSRADLNDIATDLGIEDPDKLPNKAAVIDAIRSKPEQAE